MNDSRVVWQVFVTQHQIVCKISLILYRSRELAFQVLSHICDCTRTMRINVCVCVWVRMYETMNSHVHKSKNFFRPTKFSFYRLNLFIKMRGKNDKKNLSKFNAISRRRMYQQWKQLTQIDTNDPDFLSAVSFTFKMSYWRQSFRFRYRYHFNVNRPNTSFCTLYYTHARTHTPRWKFKLPLGSNILRNQMNNKRTNRIHWNEFMIGVHLFFTKKNCFFLRKTS